jgi:DtxR family Mn-dependent transcriptional regulator
MVRKKTIEEYIEVIYFLENSEGSAQTGKIASEMKVKPSSVTEMLKKLKKVGLVKYESYTGSTLTPSGRKTAQELARRHKAIADFLEIIGVQRAMAEIDACQIEHHVSSESMQRVEKFVEFISSASCDQNWKENFRRYCEDGETLACNLFR